jgi:hypothetical protein
MSLQHTQAIYIRVRLILVKVSLGVSKQGMRHKQQTLVAYIWNSGSMNTYIHDNGTPARDNCTDNQSGFCD